MAKKKSSVTPKETLNAFNSLARDVEAAPTSSAPKSSLPAPKRGLKGVPLTATINLLIETNPKRAGSASYTRFACYESGMTQEQFIDAGGTTPDLAYDTAHGFIAVEGYTPPKMFSPKPKAEKAVREPKAKKEPKVKSQAQVELENATLEEVID